VQVKNIGIFLWLMLSFFSMGGDALASKRRSRLQPEKIPFKIVYETYRETYGRLNWELFMIHADGSKAVNLTLTPQVDEMYPHASPDGSKICFVADERGKRKKVRNVYYMNIDGSGRVRVANNARQPCWSPDGKTIAYLKGEYSRYTTREYATTGLYFYDLESGKYREHPNKSIKHLYAICWSPDGKWFVGAVQGSMKYSDTIIAFEADGEEVIDLKEWGVMGCRPDLSRDGKKIAWGETDWKLCVADIDLEAPMPWSTIANIRKVATCPRHFKVYHVDISPDGEYVAFSWGPFKGGQQVGGDAEGWNIYIADMTGRRRRVTFDGNHNKEADWVPIPTQSLENQGGAKMTEAVQEKEAERLQAIERTPDE